MMRHMCGPEKAAIMFHPVHPVEHEILENEQHDPVNPYIMDRLEKTVIIEKGKDDADVDGPEKEIDTHIQQHEINILQAILPGIGFLFPEIGQKHLQPDDDQVDRGGDQDQQLFPAGIHAVKLVH